MRHRDEAIRALYQASASLQIARGYVNDPILAARIREVAHDVLSVIGKIATAANEREVS